ncbi:hypothetical protein [Haloarchaeobius litoreus]|uniref:Uncharacterized protein n=1 Tax=Haloarchaeobius litoreus TaxID=755306 RepID=A0ABD6DR47_9EURY|nr:hypothetical protein [Haloarchaeobius litoreus]
MNEGTSSPGHTTPDELKTDKYHRNRGDDPSVSGDSGPLQQWVRFDRQRSCVRLARSLFALSSRLRVDSAQESSDGTQENVYWESGQVRDGYSFIRRDRFEVFSRGETVDATD